MNKLKSVCVVVAMMGAMTLSQGAWAAQGASISNLRFTLLDMDPDDGLTPSIVFGTLAGEPAKGQAIVSDRKPLSFDEGVITAPTADIPFGTPGTLLSLPDDRGSVVIGSDGIKVSTPLTDGKIGEFVDAVHASPWSIVASDSSASASNKPQNTNIQTDYSFVLSPSTVLQVTGTIRLDAQDSADMAAMTAILQTTALQENVRIGFQQFQSAEITLMLESDYPGFLDTARDIRLLTSEMVIVPSGVSVTGGSASSQEFNFTLGINSGSTSRLGRLVYSVESNVQFMSSAVPEPTRLALHGLGLAFMAAAVRWNRKKGNVADRA